MVLTFTFVFFLSLGLFVPELRPPGFGVLVFLGILLWKRKGNLFAILLLSSVVAWTPFLTKDLQFDFLLQPILPIVFLMPLYWFFPSSKNNFRVWMKGDVDAKSILLSVLGVFAFSGLYLLWATATNNLNSGLGLTQELSNIPKIYLFFFVLVFSLMGSAMEELFFRGVLQGCLQKELSSFPYLVVFLVSFLFASQQFLGGMPTGPSGFVLSFLFGALLSYLRMRTGTARLGFITHFCADFFVGVWLIFLSM